MGWTSDEDEQPQPAPRRAGSPTKWWEAPQPYEAPPPPWVQDAQTFKRRRPRPDARQDASVRCDAPGRALDRGFKPMPLATDGQAHESGAGQRWVL